MSLHYKRLGKSRKTGIFVSPPETSGENASISPLNCKSIYCTLTARWGKTGQTCATYSLNITKWRSRCFLHPHAYPCSATLHRVGSLRHISFLFIIHGSIGLMHMRAIHRIIQMQRYVCFFKQKKKNEKMQSG